MLRFTDEMIERLFGADDAENEIPERFKEYFYYNQVYDSLCSSLPIRIVVGHKGVGKSALLKRAHLADCESEQLSLWLRPNGFVEIKQRASSNPDFIARIETWKGGILRSVVENILLKEGRSQSEADATLDSLAPRGLPKFLQECLARTKARTINVYIDDIDRGWSASADDIKNISALLNALRDITGEGQGIKFRIGLRTDVYFLVRTSDESTDKIERNVVWLRWTNNDILRLIAKRIETFMNGSFTQERIEKLTQTDISKQILSKVIEPEFEGRGHWSRRPIHNVLLSLTRARPRDLVKLLHGAARKAYSQNSEIITSKHLESTFESYSQERLQDIINEFRSELPNLEMLLLDMKPTRRERRTAHSYTFTTAELTQKLQNVMGHVPLKFTNGRSVSAKSLHHFLFKIDFITARRTEESGVIDRKYFDESRFLANEVTEFGYDWEIHPAYRWALQPQDISHLLDTLFM